MFGPERRALVQDFLPDRAQRAFVWKYAQSIGGRRPRHFHAEPELNVIVRGSATFGVGDGMVVVSAGDLLTFPAGQDHELLQASPDLFLYAVGLEPAFSAEVLGSAGEPVVPLHVSLATGELTTVLDCAAAIVDRPFVAQLGAELWQRFDWLGRRAAPRTSRRTHVLTRRALKLMAATPELGLEGLANELDVQPSEISRHFRRDMGMTLVRYRMRSRLLDLIRRVDVGEQDLMAAAGIAGFGSYSQCHRTFRSELGCGPRQFFCSGLRDRMQLTYEPKLK